MVQFRLPSPRKPKAELASAASTPDTSSHPSLTHSISISDIDALPPMSEHILDHVLGKGRAIDRIASPSTSHSSVASPRAGYSKMDSQALYWSKEGVVKRSATVTNRMHARGVKLEYATDPRAGLPPGDVLDPTQLVPEPAFIVYKSNNAIDPKVVAEKDSKHKKIAKANASVLRSLEAAYKPAQGDKVALSEIAHTNKAPSRHLQFVDGDGNVRSLSRTSCDTPMTAPPPTPPVDEADIDTTSPVVDVQANKKRATKFWTKNAKAKDTDAELKKSESVPVKTASPPVLKKSDSAGDAPPKPTTSGWRMKFGTKEKGKETTTPVVEASASTEAAAVSVPDVAPPVNPTQSTTAATELKKSESVPAKTASPPALQKSESAGDTPAKPVATGWRAKFGTKDKDKETTGPVAEASSVPATVESTTGSEVTPTSDSAPTINRVSSATATGASSPTAPVTEPSASVAPLPVVEKKKMSGLFNKAKGEPFVKPVASDLAVKTAPATDEPKRKSAIKSVEKPKVNPLGLVANVKSGSNQALNDTVVASKDVKTPAETTDPVTNDVAKTGSINKLTPQVTTRPSVSETKTDAVSAGEVVMTETPTSTVLSPSKKRGTFRNPFKARTSSMDAPVN
ncbi:hypothetical protein SDRG_04519 [Saprolegnia diclina VS20]|uniref:Uncharacterized protein n=1 Tax=Saprolegnia diclina (strain VS20) TaxID=1156394 RepID=T0QJA1_SAPDV|nr:hypothetical protein SDRG_04519 [Saprolegnia diclina VS20]EQC38089.1 hypothetical protein SDRG_04519 [Saprolegnia diclina VS20]|eukprot:XP_008608416.1 hypothetical protein SDRG_04519 [Saprolegnia diclina VS20]